MQDAVLNLCRVKLRDQQRLDRLGYLEEYPQYPHGTFSDVVPRGGNAGGGGQPGWVLKCKGWETDPERLHLLHRAGPRLGADLRRHLSKPEWKTAIPNYMTAQGAPAAHHRHLRDHRRLACRQDQVRGGGHPAQVRHSLLAGAVNEGNRGAPAARESAHRPDAAPESSSCNDRSSASVAARQATRSVAVAERLADRLQTAGTISRGQGDVQRLQPALFGSRALRTGHSGDLTRVKQGTR